VMIVIFLFRVGSVTRKVYCNNLASILAGAQAVCVVWSYRGTRCVFLYLKMGKIVLKYTERERERERERVDPDGSCAKQLN
jgi:hypothetical protein